MAEKNQPAVNQWSSAWASYPYYSMYANMGYNAQGQANLQQYYQNAYAQGYQYNMMNSQTYQNALLQQQQQYMRNFLPGGKLETTKSEENKADGKSETKDKESDENKLPTELKEELPPLPPGSPPKAPPPPEIASPPKPNPVKFNITGKSPMITPANPLNGFANLSARQRKRKKNKMNKLAKKFEANPTQSTNGGDMSGITFNFSSEFPVPNPPLPPLPATPAAGFGMFPQTPIIPLPLPQPVIPVSDDVLNIPPPPCISGNEQQENTNTENTLTPKSDSFAKINKVKSTMDMSEWPHSLTEYVNRCYAKCKTPKEKDQISEKLKMKILQAANNDLIWVKEWDKEPMPLLESEISTMPQTPVYKPGVCRSGRNIFTRPSPVKKKRGSSDSKYSSSSSSNSYYHQSDNNDGASNKNRKQNVWEKKSKRKTDELEESEDYISIRSNDDDQSDTSSKDSEPRFKSKKYKKYTLGVGINSTGNIPVDKAVMEKRAARFSLGSKEVNEDTKVSSNTSKSLSLVWNATLNITEDRTPEATTEHIVGTCQEIEKQYLRLTSALEASSIRPPEVLQQSLARVKEKWLENQDYHYACEQLKSIRQDLTVQGIRDNLTVDVYETHARIALEKRDHYEFNQCQSQLKLLYKELDECSSKNSLEFACYRILYYIFTKDTTDLTKTIVELSAQDRGDACVSFALQLSSACAANNYKKFFKLYKEAPRMASYLIDLFLPRVRKSAVAAMIKAYRPNLPVSYVKDILGFENEVDCIAFLKEMEIVFLDGEMSRIDCKATSLKPCPPATAGTVGAAQ